MVCSCDVAPGAWRDRPRIVGLGIEEEAMSTSPIRFGFQVAPTSDRSVPDHVMYKGVAEDCRLGYSLGYHAAWFLEHHFSDYHPTPSPLVFMGYMAAACPKLNLGVSVLVLPWYHPLRVAEEIAMVNALTEGDLHLAFGRGTAKSEYDAYGVDMHEARARFVESFKIIRTALEGKPFTYDGRFTKIPEPIEIRPRLSGKPLNFYGAIGSPPTAEVMGEMGLPPIVSGGFPDHMMGEIVDKWKAKAEANGYATDIYMPVSIKLIIADTEKEANDLARVYVPRAFAAAVKHYVRDDNPWGDIPDYQAFNRIFEFQRKMTDPDKIMPHVRTQLIGTPEMICERIRDMNKFGVNYFLCSAALPGMPQDFRQEMYTKFAREVAPQFSAEFASAARSRSQEAVAAY